MEIVETSVFTDQIKRLLEDDAYKEVAALRKLVEKELL
jgi:hypothetical protein